MRWLGHQPLCWHQVPKSERDKCRGWVRALLTFLFLVIYSNGLSGVGRSAFAVGVIANIYGRLFRGNAYAVMVGIYLYRSYKLKPTYIYNLGHAHPRNEPLRPPKDNWHITSTAVRPRERRSAAFRVSADCWQFHVVPDRVSSRPAADFGVRRADCRAQHLARPRLPHPVAKAEERHLQPLKHFLFNDNHVCLITLSQYKIWIYVLIDGLCRKM